MKGINIKKVKFFFSYYGHRVRMHKLLSNVLTWILYFTFTRFIIDSRLIVFTDISSEPDNRRLSYHPCKDIPANTCPHLYRNNYSLYIHNYGYTFKGKSKGECYAKAVTYFLFNGSVYPAYPRTRTRY